MKFSFLLVPFFLFFTIHGHGNTKTMDAGTVVLNLDEYKKLVDSTERPNIHILKNLSFTGSFPSDINFTLTGQFVGQPFKVSFLKNFSYSLKNCIGDGLVSAKNSLVSVYPLKSHYTVKCKLIIPSSQAFQLSILNIMNFENLIKKTEIIKEGASVPGLNIKFIHSDQKINRAKAEIIKTGKYKVYVGPNAISFRYDFQFNNPNRNKVTEKLSWKNNEIVKSVKTNLTYSDNSAGLEIKLNPGINKFTVQGRITSSKFTPILKSDNQFFMIENHPIIQVKTKTKWKRVSTSEAGIHSSQVGAKSYYISNYDDFNWNSKKLNVFSSTGYTIKDQSIRYYIPYEGRPIVETTYLINNQGTPEIPLFFDGTVLYSEVNGSPSPLYKDDKGNLLVSLPEGEQRILVQYRPNKQVNGMMRVLGENFPKPKAVISSANLEFILGKGWDLYFGRFNNDISSILSFGRIIISIIISLSSFYLLKFMGFEKKGIITLTTCIFALGCFNSMTLAFYIFLLLIVMIIYFRKRILAIMAKSSLLKLVGFCVGFIIIVILASSMIANFTRYNRKVQRAAEHAYYKSLSKSKHSVNAKGILDNDNDFASDELEGDFQGIPAKVEIPWGGESKHFRASLIDINKQLNGNFLIAKEYLLDLYLLFFSFIIFVVLYRNRKEIIRVLIEKR